MAKTVSNPNATTKAPQKYDEAVFTAIEDHAKQLKSDDGNRDTMYRDIDEMYLMTWSGGSGKQWAKAEVRISPDARNQAVGAVRLMIATDPIFNIVNTDMKQGVADKVEKLVNKIWDAAGRANGNPIHYDAILSAILYSEIHTAITSTASLVQAAKDNGRGQARAEALAARTPFIIENWNPKDGHSEFDKFGLSGYYREVETTPAKVLSDFGNLAPQAMRDRNQYSKITLKSFWDVENAAHWTDDGVLVCQPHKLPFIPIVVQTTEGSKLWTKPEEARQPLLYGLLKSGMWSMQNMIYSVLYTVIRDMGVTPMFKHTTPPGQDGKVLELDYDEKPAVVELVAGEQFDSIINKGLIDPAVAQGLDIATQKGQESTIFPQALGGSLPNNSTFSSLSLISQQGRLPLIGTQKRGGWGIGSIAEMCLAMMVVDGTNPGDIGSTLKLSDIPKNVQVEAILDVKLPQDKLQQANIATMITQGDDPLMDKEWTRKNILNEAQSGDVDRRIWTEKATALMFQQFVQQQLQAAQMQQQQGMDGQAGQMNAGSQMAPGQGEQVQGIPPQMAGVMPGQGQAVVPNQGGQ